jgi:hypothetical protein
MNHRTPGAVGKSVEGEIESRTAMHSHVAIYWPNEMCNTELQHLRF